MVSLASVGSALQGVGAVAGALGLGSKGTSRKRELDSYRLQAQAQRESIDPLAKAYKEAGFHPLLALGQQPFTPGGAVSEAGSDLGSSMAQMGQGVSRLANVSQNAQERTLSQAYQKLQLENMQAQNDLLRAQATRIANPTTPPIGGNYALPGQGQSDVIITPKEIVTRRGDVEKGVSAADQIISYRGHPVRIPSQAAEEAFSEGPGGIVYGITTTIPDMLRAHMKNMTRNTRRLFTGDY